MVIQLDLSLYIFAHCYNEDIFISRCRNDNYFHGLRTEYVDPNLISSVSAFEYYIRSINVNGLA